MSWMKVLLTPGIPGALYTLMFLFGFFGFAMYTPSLEMGVEVTFPVAEATSAGLIVCSGFQPTRRPRSQLLYAQCRQIQGILFTVLMILLMNVEPASKADKAAFEQFCTPPTQNISCASALSPADGEVQVPNFTGSLPASIQALMKEERRNELSSAERGLCEPRCPPRDHLRLRILAPLQAHGGGGGGGGDGGGYGGDGGGGGQGRGAAIDSGALLTPIPWLWILSVCG